MPKKQKLGKGRKPTNEHQKAKYKAHFAIAEANRKRRRQKHLSLHPNDIQLLRILKGTLQ